jgi:chemotaxis protein MotA
LDLATIIGLLAGSGLILLGNILEGGHTGSLMQMTAFMIVTGGTLGAVMVGAPMADLKRSMKHIKYCFKPPVMPVEETINLIVGMARVARKDGLLALERNLAEIEDPFMKRYLMQIIDGIESEMLKDAMETEIYLGEESIKVSAKIWEGAGGFSPTIGIIGAVLGLIHTMQNLSDPSKVGAGIAVAFVATVYGVGFANLWFMPFGNKLKRLAQIEATNREMVMEGLLALQAGHNPKVIEDKLRIYATDSGKKDKKKDGE